MRWLGVMFVGWLASACASGPSIDSAQWRQRLRTAMQEPVSTRDQRDRQSRLLVEATSEADLERMNHTQVEAEFGKGTNCQNNAICQEQGFGSEDIYYPIGVATTDKIKQLPLLIIGYDQHGHVKRVFALRTH